MPNSDPRDGFFYPTFIIDFYIPLFSIEFLIILKVNDVENCIFHEPVILCDTL